MLLDWAANKVFEYKEMNELSTVFAAARDCFFSSAFSYKWPDARATAGELSYHKLFHRKI
jgi:hypothetical protein